jgi:hypothetical protein
MGDFIGLCAIVIVALSPLLRRFYISRFILDSWMEHNVLTGIISIFIFAKIHER